MMNGLDSIPDDDDKREEVYEDTDYSDTSSSGEESSSRHGDVNLFGNEYDDPKSCLYFDSIHLDEQPTASLSRDGIDEGQTNDTAHTLGMFRDETVPRQTRRRVYLIGISVVFLLAIVLCMAVSSKQINRGRSGIDDGTLTVVDDVGIRSGNPDSDDNAGGGIRGSGTDDSGSQSGNPRSHGGGGNDGSSSPEYSPDVSSGDQFEESYNESKEKDKRAERRCITESFEDKIHSETIEGGAPQVTLDDDTVVIKHGPKLFFYDYDDEEETWDPNPHIVDLKHSNAQTTMWENTIVVGLPDENDGAGAVSIFEKILKEEDGPDYPVELIGPQNVIKGTKFGQSVDIREDWLIVGAPDGRKSGSSSPKRSGQAYVYRRGREDDEESWTLERILPHDGAKFSSFGKRVAIGDNVVAVLGKNINGDNAIYLYERLASTTWEPLHEDDALGLVNDDCDDDFGSQLAFTKGNGLIVGCTGRNSQNGAIYYYTLGNHRYELKQKIGSSDKDTDVWFEGTTDISVDEDVMVVGSAGVHGGLGRAYVWRIPQFDEYWREEAKIRIAEPGIFEFGSSVVVSGNDVVICSEDSAFYFSLDMESCDERTVST